MDLRLGCGPSTETGNLYSLPCVPLGRLEGYKQEPLKFLSVGQSLDLTQSCFIDLLAPGTVLTLAISQPGIV